MQTSKGKASMVGTVTNILKTDGAYPSEPALVETKLTVVERCSGGQKGVLGLYPGLSASIFRQMTYSITRFGAYEAFKDVLREQCMSSSSREARVRLRV